MKTNVKLGQKYTDAVTGIEGVACGVSFFLNGCVSVQLVYAHEGEEKSLWLDEQRCTVSGIPVVSEAAAGGPRTSYPPKRRGQ